MVHTIGIYIPLVCSGFTMKIIISKESKIRKQELIDAALRLFYEKGYEQTSIDDINREVGVTKGAFYYHFTSKEDLLEQTASFLSEKTIQITKKICNDPKLDAPEKIHTILKKVYEHRIKNMEAYQQLFQVFESESNLILKKRIWDKVWEGVKKPYERMIRQGIDEGVFKTDYVEEIFEMVMILGDYYRKRLFILYLESEENPGAIEDMKRKALFMQETMEHLLGVPKGCLNVAEQMLVPYAIKQ
jgi:AcrR family transcriptional regulator